MIWQWAASGNQSERDLFVARAVLGYLALKNCRDANLLFAELSQRIEQPSPLLNFIKFLLLCVTRDAAPLFEELCRRYKPSLDRDPAFGSYLEAIGKIYFNIQAPQNPMQAMMQNLMGGMMG